ncbi:MAG TPA: c-type cytochrome, partial [Anaerolineae bacterium]
LGGGPACISCHTVAGTGVLGGGALGPDLTHVAQRYGEAGLAAALKNIAFPTMVGPFANRPLTAQEQADLVAFFKQIDQQQPPVPVIGPGALTVNAWLTFAIGLAGMAVLFLILLFFWPRQRQSVSERLRNQGRERRA